MGMQGYGTMKGCSACLDDGQDGLPISGGPREDEWAAADRAPIMTMERFDGLGMVYREGWSIRLWKLQATSGEGEPGRD